MRDNVKISVYSSDHLIDLRLGFPDGSHTEVTMRPRDVRWLIEMLKQASMAAALRGQLG